MNTIHYPSARPRCYLLLRCMERTIIRKTQPAFASNITASITQFRRIINNLLSYKQTFDMVPNPRRIHCKAHSEDNSLSSQSLGIERLGATLADKDSLPRHARTDQDIRTSAFLYPIESSWNHLIFVLLALCCNRLS